MSMRQKVNVLLKALAGLFLAVDVAALLFCCTWAFHAGTREGEQAYAIVFLIVLALLVAVGGGVFVYGIRRRSAFGVGAAATILGLPSMVGLALWLGLPG